MNLHFDSCKISSIELILPENEVYFDDEIGNYTFSKEQSQKLKRIFEFKKRRIVENGVTSSDLVVHGFQSMVIRDGFQLGTIDALIVVTQTPDYLIPGTSYIVHGQLGMKKEILCLDLNQGCAGYIIGLTTSFSLLKQSSIQRVALVNVDVVSQLVSKSDRNSRPLIGDAASITIIDSAPASPENESYSNIYSDGARWDALMVPAGGMRIRSNGKTNIKNDDGSGNIRSLENLVMKGDAVFSFVMETVPLMIEKLMNYSNVSKEDVDAFLLHQPNSFILTKIAEKLAIPIEKVPHQLVSNYGNSSGVSIPAVMCTHFEHDYFNYSRHLCLSGFGVGLTCASMLIRMKDVSLNISTYP